MTNLGVTLGNSVRKLRGKTSQSDFAEMFGVNLRTYQRYESGERLFPDEVLEKITAKFDMELEDLFRKESGKSVKGIDVPVTQFVKKITAVPDSIFDLAAKLGPDHEVWNYIADDLKEVIELEEKKGSKGKKSQA